MYRQQQTQSSKCQVHPSPSAAPRTSGGEEEEEEEEEEAEEEEEEEAEEEEEEGRCSDQYAKRPRMPARVQSPDTD
jgi:ribosomal protein L12E/L44/L45/RPP1/RPP2